MRTLLGLITICLVSAGSLAATEQPATEGDNNTLSEYVVVGTVVSVKPAAATVMIRQANLLGDLRLYARSFRVKQPSSLSALRPGDRIMGIYSPRDKMLHRVREARRRDDRYLQSKAR